MKILYNASTSAGWDQRISTRDVCVVTRSPMLMELARAGHEITLTNPPIPPTKEDIEWVNKEVDPKLIKLNDERVDYLNGKIKIMNDFNKEFKKEDFDFAITELRTQLYFHEGITPKDVEIQRKIWDSGLPYIVHDKDCWMEYEQDFFNEDTGIIVGPTNKYEVSCPKLAQYHEVIDFGIDKDLVGLGSFRQEEKLVDYGYLGSEYNRADSLFRFYYSPAKKFKTKIVGKMYEQIRTGIKAEFLGRTPILSGKQVLDNFKVTTHICPKYYGFSGHVTHRIYEGVSSDCLLLSDKTIRDINLYLDEEYLVSTAEDVEKILSDDDKIIQLKKLQKESIDRSMKNVAEDFIGLGKQLINDINKE